jgi:hypothetical protein
MSDRGASEVGEGQAGSSDRVCRVCRIEFSPRNSVDRRWVCPFCRGAYDVGSLRTETSKPSSPSPKPEWLVLALSIARSCKHPSYDGAVPCATCIAAGLEMCYRRGCLEGAHQ